jgi:hypothetical protein
VVVDKAPQATAGKLQRASGDRRQQADVSGRKIDARSGKAGRIVWRMDPGQEKIIAMNRGAALWGGLVVTVANHPPRMIATNKAFRCRRETGRGRSLCPRRKMTRNRPPPGAGFP